MADRYFTPEEVEALIPKLTSLVERLQEAHAEAESRRARMKAEEDRVAFSGGGIFDQAGWRADRDALDAAVARAQKAVERIREVGGTPKDATLGLVDFPTVRDGGLSGIKLFGVRPGDVLSALGFENGDTVVALDKHPDGDPKLAVSPEVRRSKRVTFQIERQGKPRELVVQIVRDPDPVQSAR